MKAVFPAFDGFALTAVTAGLDEIEAKRLLDLGLATLLLILLTPLLALVSLAVALDSRGPVLFCQKRTGLNGKTFPIFKFRSMHVMEDGAEVKQAIEGDARITRVGRIIRKLSLDELPQLFNVLAGEMSLVGPRPHAVAHDTEYGAAISNYAVRFQVKPGITGWAQVNGARGATPTTGHHAAARRFRRLVRRPCQPGAGPDDPGAHARWKCCAQGTRSDARALSIPAQYEAPAQPALEAANDSYSEVTVGGIATACLSRDGLARMMLQDCLDARSNPARQPKLVFASNGHAIALAAQDEAFRFTFETGRHHSCRRPGRGVCLAHDRDAHPRAQRHHRLHP